MVLEGTGKKSSFVVFTVQEHFFAIDFELNGVCVWIKVIWIAEFLLEHHYWGWICYTGPVISRMTTSIAVSVVDFLCYTNTPKHNGIALLNWWMAKFTWVNVSPFDLPQFLVHQINNLWNERRNSNWKRLLELWFNGAANGFLDQDSL